MKRRDEFTTRENLADEQFLLQLNAGGELGAICCAIRSIVADQCKIAKEKIYPGDDTQVLSLLMKDWDVMTFVLKAEEVLKIEIDEKKVPPFTRAGIFGFTINDGPENFGRWCLDVAGRICDPD
ncbi:hypothetical protein LLG95_07550 [bacterium]|nr:hypothetical protein [bacterium]